MLFCYISYPKTDHLRLDCNCLPELSPLSELKISKQNGFVVASRRCSVTDPTLLCFHQRGVIQPGQKDYSAA